MLYRPSACASAQFLYGGSASADGAIAVPTPNMSDVIANALRNIYLSLSVDFKAKRRHTRDRPPKFDGSHMKYKFLRSFRADLYLTPFAVIAFRSIRLR
jgi:hypothetical protein